MENKDKIINLIKENLELTKKIEECNDKIEKALKEYVKKGKGK